MKTTDVSGLIAQLENWFCDHAPCTIATSGGIDSMLLAFIANRAIGEQAFIVHSASSAVPDADARRIRAYAQKYHWHYQLVDSGEINDANYQQNPVDRCYYCKSCLFTTIKQIKTGAIVTGTNMDDLSDYRPGLVAAQQNDVQQPYVDLGINKATIRQIASYLQLDDLKDIPASPCLASRIETGIKINTDALHLVDRVETLVKELLATDVVRFRIRKQALEIQLAADCYQQLSSEAKNTLTNNVLQHLPAEYAALPLQVSAYAKGSAFVGDKSGHGQ